MPIRIIEEYRPIFPNHVDTNSVEPLCQRRIRLVRQQDCFVALANFGPSNTVAQLSDQLRVQMIPSMGELPAMIGDRLYVVGQPGKFKWAILMCPCGCGERLDVCLMPSARPRWELTLREGRASLSPSIWVPRERCGSHFWLQRNKIIWCRSDDR